MNRRNGETPMEFEWQSGAGPMDATSGFAKLALKHQNENLAKKRTHSIFDSPTKPSTPSLREPASQTFLFSKPLPPQPFYDKPSFTTPRKIDTDFCSSGPENDTSPEHNGDSEATPDMGFRSALAKTSNAFSFSRFAGAEPSAKEKDKKAVLLGKPGSSPGRGEIARRPYSNAIEKRARKNRRRDAAQLQLTRRRGSSGSDDDDETATAHRSKPTTSSAPPAAGPSTLHALFTFLETHPSLPHILSFYAQLLLNLFLISFFIYLTYSFWSTIRADVDKKSDEAVADALAELAVCAQHYADNRCARELRVPAMEAVCNNWEKCMARDPRSVGRARVSAKTFAEILDGFVEPISYKAMIFILLSLFGSIAISNFAFGFFRNRALSQWNSAPGPYNSYAQPPPVTPHRHFSAHQHQLQQQRQQEFFTPYGGGEPAGPSMGAGGGGRGDGVMGRVGWY